MAVRKRPTGRPGRQPTVGDLCVVMEAAVAPTWAAAEWDNVGLLVGERSRPARRALLTIDLTPAVLDEAIGGRFDVILAYHPPIFRAVKRMTPDRAVQEGLAAAALAHRIAIYSPHTALDAAPGGTNDTLAALAGLCDATPFQAAAGPKRECKLVVFVPDAAVSRVAEAVFDAGGGWIGEYKCCSFRTPGQGSFWGTAGTHPVVGERGKLELVGETRLEIIFPRGLIAEVTRAVRSAHPYEEPAFDIYPLEPLPRRGTGQGRIGRFPKPVSLGALAQHLVRKTGSANAAIVGRSGQRLRRGFVCVGAAGSLPLEVPGDPCGPGDVVLTGEVRHHEALRYQRIGAAVIALGHWASERPVLRPLAARLRRLVPGLAVTVSRKDRDPFTSV
ncbi:MAG: YqfO family protein [Phycisphaerae bacterium]